MEEKIQQFFDQMKNIEENLLSFIDENNHDFIIIDYFDGQKITENKSKFKSFLYLLVHILNNYHRNGDISNRIFKIFNNYKDSIQTYFQNFEIFNIFKSNKQVLLFLIQNKLLLIDQNIIDILLNQAKYIKNLYVEYFFPEIELFLHETFKNEIKNRIKELNVNNIEQFNEKRKIGQNDSYICSLIRNDQVVDFISYLERTNISPSSIIKQSIFETNPFLLKRDAISLIEYAAFFGAQQIFRFLVQKGAELTTSIWPYIVHGKNPDLIHFLEEREVKTLNESYQYLINEALKCHHNEIADYFQVNYCQKEKIYDQYLLKKSLKYYNFNFIKTTVHEIIQLSLKSDLFYFFCKYDYSSVVELLLSIPDMNINKKIKIYKPIENMEDIIQSIAIKNGEIDNLPKTDHSDWYYWSDERKEEEEEREYKDENDYGLYNYDLEMANALQIAVRKGNIDIIKLLFQSKDIDFGSISKKYSKSPIEPDYNYWTIIEEKSLLHEAIVSGFVDIVAFLLASEKVNFNENLIMIKKYFDSHSTACLSYRKEDHKTPLIFAVKLGYSDIFKFLLSQDKAYINQKSYIINLEEGGCIMNSRKIMRTEKTPLHVAIKKKNLNIVKICLEHLGIDINIPFVVKDIDGWDYPFNHPISDYFKKESDKISISLSTLYLAVSSGNIDIVRLLLNQPNININMISIPKPKSYDKPKQVRTALHAAVLNNQIEIIQLLLQQKTIDIDVLDENGKKARDLTDDEKIKKLFDNS